MTEVPNLNPDETLDILRTSLDADAFEVASNALQAEYERRERQAVERGYYTDMANMVAGYEYIFQREGYAHTDGVLTTSCLSYLEKPKLEGIPEELDSMTRLYAAYFLVQNPGASEDYEIGPLYPLIQRSGVDEEALHRLLVKYVHDNYEVVNEEIPSVEVCIERELFYGHTWDDYLPNPGLIDQIKQGLFDQGHGELYETARYIGEDD